MGRLAGKIAIVTGAAKGLGEAGRGAGANPLGAAEDIANLIAFRASDESRFINGQRHVIDNSASVTQGAVPSRRV